MAYHLKSSETIPEGLKRVVSEELESAASQLEGKGGADRDEAIHEARKSVKRIRAVARLMRLELGGRFRVENTRMRDLGRKLSEYRDAGAMVETLDALSQKYGGELGRRTLAPVRRALASRKKQRDGNEAIGHVLDTIARAVREVGKDIETWPLEAGGFEAIAPGLQQTYRTGRKALARVKKHPRPENYHEWRKRVKDHWYHIRLLEDIWTGGMSAYEKGLKDLETWLGDDHNLVVLGDTIAAEPESYGTRKDLDLLLKLIDEYQEELRDNAVSLGERIYERKPRQFTKNIQRLWEAWQQQPPTLKTERKQASRRQKAAPSNAA